MVQVWLAYKVNACAQDHFHAICKAQVSTFDLLAGLGDRPASETEGLRAASDQLGAVAGEIESEITSSPSRVLFMEARPAVVGILLSGLGTILILRFRGFDL
mmetsp:Transcript_37587/g.58694  ORF Transcript_37587/g.58694 Transcript_37587/m.58694 type:complete len:102 (-) Transcript_37587:159-464(-)